ncbi:MAG: hypothetical protein B6D63_00550 [Candidatus Latescibacteria bacterium 4484_7]|nr:MAG: hypothetical protein B6D63_00550 [Candidatus Latescibacteria bacterium 4484_7]
MFLPLKDINPTERVPIVTILLIAANVVVYFIQFALGPGASNAIIAAYGTTPFEITHFSDLVGAVPFGGYSIVHYPGPHPIFLTLFTSMFIHAGFFHLAGNMLYLWIFGNNIEDILGPFKFIVFYVLSGLFASALYIASGPSSVIPAVGASGAISGVLGAYLIAYPRARVLTLVFLGYFIRMMVIPASFLIIFWFVMQLLFGLASLGRTQAGGVAWFAHIGGFIGGIVLIYAMAGQTVQWLRHGGGSDFYDY